VERPLDRSARSSPTPHRELAITGAGDVDGTVRELDRLAWLGDRGTSSIAASSSISNAIPSHAALSSSMTSIILKT
jgi:hypothetical protein